MDELNLNTAWYEIKIIYRYSQEVLHEWINYEYMAIKEDKHVKMMFNRIQKMSQVNATELYVSVMLTSPRGMWKVWVSGRHRSTKTVIRPWSISLLRTQRSPSKPSALMMLTTRSSTIGSRLENSELRLWQVRVPGSYTEQNHELIYDSCSVYIVWIKCMYIS